MSQAPEATPLLDVGLVVGAHGVRGALRVRWLGDGPETLLSANQLWLARPGERDRPTHFEVTSTSNPGSRDLRMQLRDLDDRDEARGWRGASVLVAPDALDALAEGEHYWHELIGCSAVDQHGDAIGVVREIWETGAHDVLVVEAGDGQDHLIPTASEYLSEIDVENRRVVIQVIPGLLDPDSG